MKQPAELSVKCSLTSGNMKWDFTESFVKTLSYCRSTRGCRSHNSLWYLHMHSFPFHTDIFSFILLSSTHIFFLKFMYFLLFFTVNKQFKHWTFKRTLKNFGPQNFFKNSKSCVAVNIFKAALKQINLSCHLTIKYHELRHRSLSVG